MIDDKFFVVQRPDWSIHGMCLIRLSGWKKNHAVFVGEDGVKRTLFVVTTPTVRQLDKFYFVESPDLAMNGQGLIKLTDWRGGYANFMCEDGKPRVFRQSEVAQAFYAQSAVGA